MKKWEENDLAKLKFQWGKSDSVTITLHQNAEEKSKESFMDDFCSMVNKICESKGIELPKIGIIK